MQRLIKALKQARAEKELREREESLRRAEGQDGADRNFDIKSGDSTLIYATMNDKKCLNIGNFKKFIILPQDRFKGIWDIVITL